MSNDGAGALAGVEAAAARGAVCVAAAGTGDELGARGNGSSGGVVGGSRGRGRGSGSSGLDSRSRLGVRALDSLRGVVVGAGVAEPASTVTLLSDDCTSALAGVEATAARCTVRVRLARAGDELGACRSTGDVGGSGD